jgi:hypothetical protein
MQILSQIGIVFFPNMVAPVEWENKYIQVLHITTNGKQLLRHRFGYILLLRK